MNLTVIQTDSMQSFSCYNTDRCNVSLCVFIVPLVPVCMNKATLSWAIITAYILYTFCTKLMYPCKINK